MVEKNSARYIDILQKIVDSYNKTWHSGIRSEPVNPSFAFYIYICNFYLSNGRSI